MLRLHDLIFKSRPRVRIKVAQHWRRSSTILHGFTMFLNQPWFASHHVHLSSSQLRVLWHRGASRFGFINIFASASHRHCGFNLNIIAFARQGFGSGKSSLTKHGWMQECGLTDFDAETMASQIVIIFSSSSVLLPLLVCRGLSSALTDMLVELQAQYWRCRIVRSEEVRRWCRVGLKLPGKDLMVFMVLSVKMENKESEGLWRFQLWISLLKNRSLSNLHQVSIYSMLPSEYS